MCVSIRNSNTNKHQTGCYIANEFPVLEIIGWEHIFISVKLEPQIELKRIKKCLCFNSIWYQLNTMSPTFILWRCLLIQNGTKMHSKTDRSLIWIFRIKDKRVQYFSNVVNEPLLYTVWHKSFWLLGSIPLFLSLSLASTNWFSLFLYLNLCM